eukprot:1759210-Pleurochrysis_carterae.AAC.1
MTVSRMTLDGLALTLARKMKGRTRNPYDGRFNILLLPQIRSCLRHSIPTYTLLFRVQSILVAFIPPRTGTA